MRSKEEILNSFNIQGADGMPEISADDLLNSMEIYKQEAVEDAFNAARKLNPDSITQPNYKFASLHDYLKSLEVAAQQNPADEINQSIALVADSILPNFLPNDSTIKEFSFNFPLQGSNYQAFYKKDTDGYWLLHKWELVN